MGTKNQDMFSTDVTHCSPFFELVHIKIFVLVGHINATKLCECSNKRKTHIRLLSFVYFCVLLKCPQYTQMKF